MSVSILKNSTKNLNLIDKFREQFSAEENKKLTLPQIIVVGDQSSGKSSILEAISGVKLPKGVDTVTKCPVIMQMRSNDNEKTTIKYRNIVKNIDISNTESEVIKIQNEVFKDQLTKEPITIFIESSKVPTLTVIDLPGIIKTATTGYTTESKEKTVEISKFYMQQQNSLILCVLPANQDISTTTTIDLAKECNKDKSRIIGVLTKIDKVDEKEIKMLPDILKNLKLPIDKGYYGLTVGDEYLKLSEDKRDQFEEEQLHNLSLLLKDKQRLGLKNLVGMLQKELLTLINRSIPILKKNINLFIEETKNELECFSMYDGKIELQKQYIIRTLNEIENKTKAIVVVGDGEIQHYPFLRAYIVDNKYLDSIIEHQTLLSIWNNIFEELYDNFNKTFEKFFNNYGAQYGNPSILEDLMLKVQTERNSMFDNPKPFKIIINKVLEEFEITTKKCLDKCCSIMEQMIENELINDIDQKLFAMKTDIKACGFEVLNQQKEETLNRLEFLFKSEKFYFVQKKIIKLFPRKNSVTENNHLYLNNTEYENGKKLKEHLEDYLSNVIRRLGDVIPNFIILGLFKNFSTSFKEMLLSLLFSEEKLIGYFSISNEEKMKNENLKTRLTSLMKFKSELNEL